MTADPTIVRMFPAIPQKTSRDRWYNFVTLPPGSWPRKDVGAERMFGFRWFCIPAWEDPDAPAYMAPERPARKYAAYCGAPPGIRCSCGAQLAGHDPGDEDPRSP